MKVRVNSIEIDYIKEGCGKPLILLHGNGEDKSIFMTAIELLKNHFTVYALDTRGHGKSTPIVSLHYMDFASDVAAFIEKLKLEKPIVYGFSDGGITALLLAIHYDIPLEKIIVSGANSNPLGLKDSVLKEMEDEYHNYKSPLLKLMLTEPNITKEELQSIKVPTVITMGENDCIKQSDADFIFANIKESKLYVLPGEDHSSYIAYSPKIAEIIINNGY